MTELQYEPILKQEYTENNCVFSAGFVTGHEVDTMYIRMEKDGDEPTTILLRPDEMACIAWLASGVLWSKLVDKEIDTERLHWESSEVFGALLKLRESDLSPKG